MCYTDLILSAARSLCVPTHRVGTRNYTHETPFRSDPEIGQVDGDGIEGGDPNAFVAPEGPERQLVPSRSGIGIEGAHPGIYEPDIADPEACVQRHFFRAIRVLDGRR